MLRISLLLLALVMTACGGPRYVDFFPCYDDGQLKPRVILLPVVQGNCSDKSNKICEDIEQGILYAGLNSGNLYFLADEEIPCDIRALSGVDFFGTDLSFTKEMRIAEYVVMIELLENGLDQRSFIMQKERLRVVDLRSGQPVVVLQETIQSNFRMPGKGQSQANVKLCKEIVDRLENVLWSLH